jgi:hypothetical protein
MTQATAKIHVTKLAAAQRQLRAAIRLYFAEEDELAIHTVGAAAYALLRDLKADRGRDEAADYYLTTIFYAVRDYRRGSLPAHLAQNDEFMRWVKEIAEELPIGPDTQFDEIVASVSQSDARRFWNRRNRVANFLKHATRDAGSHLALEDVDNLELLMQALSAYVDLLHDQLEPEGFTLWLYHSIEHGAIDGLPMQVEPIARKIESVSAEKRRYFCAEYIKELRARADAT